MCNRARLAGEPETLHARFSASWAQDVVRPNVSLEELYPKSRAYIVREERDRRVVDVMSWDVLGGEGPWPMTNVRNLKSPQWRTLAAEPSRRCLVPLTEFCEWTPDKHQVGEGKPVKGEMWFAVAEQPVFAVAGFWQQTAKGPGFTMVTCDPNELVAPIHPKAMITILHEADWYRWLRGSYADVIELQQPYPAAKMTVRGPIFPTRTG
ncbi:SOS response-associated peptidase family protein [Sphingomonas aerophila]|uniref:Abasic site processing protein n=1 Tax=Sphingomonas aerophila TaxID=1344948 RepID=A0A7W9BCR4_9SPHN|nr:SOS response-associated peptidase family protein [Sphingomonas aerophila]MBB5714780.1 putative SOS response-associated peptidase YedK [Sphingomonas aerophila]